MSTQNSGESLLTETHNLMRRLHYSIHTERAYCCDRVARFIRFHQMEAREAHFCQYEEKSGRFSDSFSRTNQRGSFNIKSDLQCTGIFVQTNITTTPGECVSSPFT